MRNILIAAPWILLYACGSGAGPADAADATNPFPDVTDAAPDAGPTEITIASDAASVHFRVDRFAMQVRDATGRVLLDALDADPNVEGDTAHAYGPLGATHHSTTFKPVIIEGWDHVRGSDSPWHHATQVVRWGASATSASFELADPGDPAVRIALDVSVDGDEVRVGARVVNAPAGPGDAGSGGDAGDAGAREDLNQMGQAFRLPADEHFFGLGERFVTVDHRGRHYECWSEELGLGKGEDAPPGPDNPSPNGPGMTSIPIPFFVSSRGYGLWVESTYRTGFSLGADDPSVWRLYAETPELHYRVLVHANPRDTIEHYTRLTGRAPLPAPWVFGPRRRVDHGVTVNGVPEYQALRDNDVATTMVDDTTHFLPAAHQIGQEADLLAWNATLHDLGFKSIAYFNPYVSVEDPSAADLLAEARANHYLLQLDDGSEFQTAVVSGGARLTATVDFTNPAAVRWYQGLLGQALDLGYDGWMQDFGEYVPQRARFYDGSTGWELHNAFPMLVEQAVFEYLTERRGDDFMFFARAGYVGSQHVVPVIWSGDPSASFDDGRGLPGNVRAALNAGISGFPFWGSDISGYTCLNDPPADKDVYLRWAEFGALSTDMHDENACGGAPPDAPPKWTLWSDAETTAVYGRYARLHTRLFPYLYAAAREATETGMPVMRHPVLVHPTEPDAFGVEFEYYFGPALYVAPVVRRAATTRTLWLPPGQWFDFFTSEPITGGQRITRDAPLDALPLFLRAGGVVPMLDPNVDTLAPESRGDVVGPDDVAGVYDLRAAVDAETGSGHAQLVTGEVFDVALARGGVTLPPEVTEAPDEATLASCDSCGRVDPVPNGGGALRVRVTTARTTDATLRAGALTLRHHAGVLTRVRWDVLVLPST